MGDMTSLGSDIYLLGLGIFEMRHVTVDARDILGKVKRVLHLTDRHADLCALNPNTEDITRLYSGSGTRIGVYDEIASYVVSSARRERPIALVQDGNPMFFSDVAWKTVALGRKEGLRVEATPGVSCIDVLPMQLGFEAGNLGMQILEATQLALYRLDINPYLSTLILQVGIFGETSAVRPPTRRTGAFVPLVEHLTRFFAPDHPAIFIESAYSRTEPTKLFATEISSIQEHSEEIGPGMTLYLPRVAVPKVDPIVCQCLGVPELPKELES